MRLSTHRAIGFRNLDEEVLEWHDGFNVLVGANGHGKTNLLESINVLGSLRSFRSATRGRLVQHGRTRYEIEGEVVEAGHSVRLRHVFDVGPPRSRTLLVDGVESPPGRYLNVLPVVAMSAGDRDLVVGEPRERRAFLDRFAFLLEPMVVDELRAYRRTLRQRNAALQQPDSAVEAWEAGLGAAAARVVARRRAATEWLVDALTDALSGITGDGFPSITVDYRTERWLRGIEDRSNVEQIYTLRYNTDRARDRRMGHTVDGPHRHDLALKADGRPVRDVLSSGQTKVVAAALRIAMLRHVERERGRRLPVVIDDIDAELDRCAMRRLLRGLGTDRQVFVSTARGEMVLEDLPNGAFFRIQDGRRLTQSRA